MDRFYVSTDAHGIEHTPTGHVQWSLPSGNDAARETVGEQPLLLRRPVALLEVLDEQVFTVSPEVAGEREGETLAVPRARIVADSGWGTERAAIFALNCAEHVASPIKVALPDGTAVLDVIAEARQYLDDVSDAHAHHLARLSRLSAMRRLKRERKELSDLLFTELVEDERRDVDALDDPGYDDLRAVIDSVLAAIEALRHHVLPRFYIGPEARLDEREAHHALDAHTAMPVPTSGATPWGPVPVGGGPVLKFEPAWTAAREAARHAREAVEVASGSQQAAAERGWQGSELERLLEHPS